MKNGIEKTGGAATKHRAILSNIMVVALFPLAVASLNACIMVRSNDSENRRAAPIQTALEAKSISIEVLSTSPSDEKQHRIMQKAYEESGLFSKVTAGSNPTDLKAEVLLSGLEARTNGFMRLLNGMTLTLIPDKIEYTPTVTAVFKDRQGNTISTFKKSEDISIWVELFLVFAMPFVDGPNTVAESVFYDLHRAIINEAHAKGTL
jgi:hypothetical protein